MAAIPTILQGDDSGAISITLATGHVYEGATLVAAYQGVTREFTDLEAGGSVQLSFSHDETAGFKVGCFPLLLRLVGATGAEETLENADARITVTDCLLEVNAGGSFAVTPGAGYVPLTDLEDVSDRFTLADLKAKINAVVRTLAQRSLLGLAALLFAAAASASGLVEAQKARLDTIYNDAEVVTNVTGGAGNYETVSNLAMSAIQTLEPATNYVDAATNAVLDITAGKRDQTNNVCAADSFAYSAWSKENLPSGETWDDQPTYDAGIDMWEWGYNGGSAQSEEGGADATLLTFGYGEGFTSTRTATKIAISNDTFTTYGYVTNAIANATPDLTSRTTFAQATNIAAYASASVSNALDSAKRDKVDLGVYEVTYAPWHTDTGPEGGLYADFAYTGSGGTVWRGRTDASLFIVRWEVHDDGTKKWSADFYGYSMENTTAAEDALSVTLTDTGGTYTDVTITRQYVSSIVKSETKKLATTNDIWSIASAVAAATVGMTENAAVLTNGALKTRGGTTITAANVSGAQTAADVQTAIESAGHMTQREADEAYYPICRGNSLSNQVAEIGGYLNAEDARFVVTNYDSTTVTPEASMEVKIDGAWTNVWREARRWDAFTHEYVAFSNDVVAALDEKADRAWGSYDSSTGEYAPTNYTWISSPCVAISAGMAYQRVISTGGEVWVLRATDAYTFGGLTNGYFRIEDSEGNCHFEIIKGDKVTVPAEWDGASFAVTNFSGVNHIYLRYPVVSDTHPTAECATHLETSLVDWHDETDSAFAFNATWTGSSGDWHLEVWPKDSTTKTQAFLRATYLRGGETKIINHAAVQLTTLVIGGVTYAVGTNTISGSTVLTLTPAP